MKIGIIGAGAVGSIIAREFSKLPSEKAEMTLMARTAREGFTILENGEKTFHEIPILKVADVDAVFDVLFIAAKTPALIQLQERITEITHDESEIIYALNGMGYDSMYDQGIPSVVYVSGQQHSDYIEHFVNQKIILPDMKLKYVDELILLIEEDDKVNFELVKNADFEKMRYEKLLINVGINSVTGLTKNTAKIFEDAGVVMLTRDLLAESIRVVNECNTEGVVIEEDFIEEAINIYKSYPAEMGTSMYYDVMASKPTEFQYIQKFIYDMKADSGIPTPVLDVLVTLLRGYEIK